MMIGEHKYGDAAQRDADADQYGSTEKRTEISS